MSSACHPYLRLRSESYAIYLIESIRENDLMFISLLDVSGLRKLKTVCNVASKNLVTKKALQNGVKNL
jgi:hypothetical protein